MSFLLTFDEAMLKQLKGEDLQIERRLQKIFKKIVVLGPRAGVLIDVQDALYEVKQKSPPIRVYFCYDQEAGKIIIFEYEMKTSSEKQQLTINRLREKFRSRRPSQNGT